MKTIFYKHNFKLLDNNLWIKNYWSIRIYKNLIEVFNDPEKSTGKYYINSIENIDLDFLLDELDNEV